MNYKYSGDFTKYKFKNKFIVDCNLVDPVLNYYKIDLRKWVGCLNSSKVFLYSSSKSIDLPNIDEDYSCIDINHLSTDEKEDLRDLFKSKNNE
tara:strand:- start:224 stop:502 length:279 start_codon:yes stop_codon:yes gene_type:complete